MLRTLIAAFVFAFAPTTHHLRPRVHHARYGPVKITALDLCVANRENGEPGSYSYSTINWHADNEYEGAYSEEHAKWVSGGGLRYAAHAYEATPAQQSAVFNRQIKTEPGAWPNTLPACGG